MPDAESDASPYPCETCGGPVVIVDHEPVCVRDSRCLRLPGCDGRSHQIECNEKFYTRVTPTEADGGAL